ncbi:fimbrial protein [Pseudomonas chlororaphis subsp. aurantiaca]|uniref:fimbrial protein n=1 Tax=Pseudomonas chlororaphis TaxID=587753 RepID=UPI0027DD2352|nr:fimbrial protein [Pseudomonas chlororaphis]WMI97533.1 fimbrial protein [Pseudomonas chlororaphis subsp. aurantiaca]
MSLFLSVYRVGVFLIGVMCCFEVFATAACQKYWAPMDLYIDFDQVIRVSKEQAVGSVFYQTPRVPIQTGSYAFCRDGHSSLEAAYFGRQENTQGVVPTSIAGVGMRIRHYNASQGIQTISDLSRSVDSSSLGDYYAFFNGSEMFAELIKTGDIQKGQRLSSGKYATMYVHGDFGNGNPFMNVLNVYARGDGYMLVYSCSVNQQTTQVNMGNVNAYDFSGVGSTAGERSFSVGLACEAGTRVAITLDGTSDPSGAPGVLALDSASSGTTATGVGLQLLHGTAPVTLGVPVQIGSAPVDGPYNVELRARYYKTASTVVGGEANSTATFTMTYN